MIPWYEHVITVETARAGLILVALFLAAWAWRRSPWRVAASLHREPLWHFRWVKGPWPVHVCLGFLSIDVMRRET